VQEIQQVQKNKRKEIEELVDLELKKNEYKQELENSLFEIEEMSELLKKLKRVEITEYKQKEAEKKLDDNINQLEFGDPQNSKISPNLSNYMKDPPNLEQLQKFIQLTDTKNNSGQIDRKSKKKPHVTAYKKYTSGDIFAALEEVKKGKSALQVSKQFNIPSRTLYYRAKKMGITLPRNMSKKSLAKNFNAAYVYPKNSVSKLLDRNGSELGVEGEIKTGPGLLFNLQRTFVENVFEDYSENDWTFLL
jgi:hypothetical protein